MISVRYIGAFGSFIGLVFAFGQVLYINFLAGRDSPAQASPHVAQVAFIGPDSNCPVSTTGIITIQSWSERTEIRAGWRVRLFESPTAGS